MSNGLSKKQICEKVGVSTKTFERFLDSQGKDLGKAEGQSHERFYGEETVQKFKAWLKQNQLNQGRDCGSKNLLSEIKSTAGQR